MGIDSIRTLVERFETHHAAYTSGQYNETQLRREFLDPFFKALGWDVFNEKGYDEAYKEVIHEDALKIGMTTKAPDYAFRIGGVRKFFVEAKKPSVNIKEDASPAYQLRRYAWNVDMPLSILTDFQEFSVYDCRFKPAESDKAHVARVMYLTYQEYIQRWDDLAGLFSQEAILKGSFDKFAGAVKKKGTATVDQEFLKEIESWRDKLARTIALRNERLSTDDLNFAVQRTIDRVIFLRICEDRGIESYGRFLGLVGQTQIYPKMVEMFHRADEKYNSGLFHFRDEKDIHEPPDGVTLALKIDDQVLAEIIKSIYPPCPYEFSVMPADILGQVYEQFLGKVIRLTAGHQAKVDYKPEVKKAGGVFYTPTYIVDYLVKNTVGKLLEGKTPKQAALLRILDIGCGSGSFLIGAFQYLLDWHRDWYVKDGPEKHPKEICKGTAGDWRLTISERKRILLNNIYGVDIDIQAVEVTKLSLLLKVLEGETQTVIEKQLKMFNQRALPDLSRNIKCGNSLVGHDFYHGGQMDLFSDAEKKKINAFDWEREFPEIMKAGGFDAIVGNPPYVRQEILGDDFKQYVKTRYRTFAGTADLYVYFIERGHQLLKAGGLFGVICCNKFMRTKYGRPLRDFLVQRTTLLQIVDFGELPVFQNAATFPTLLLTNNEKAARQKFIYAPLKRLDFTSLEDEVKTGGMKLDDRSLKGDNWTLAPPGEVAIIEKMKAVGVPLGEYVKGQIYYGIKTGLNEAFVIDGLTKKRLIKEDPKCAKLIKPFAVGDDIRKYRIDFKDRYLILIPKGWTRSQPGFKGDAWTCFRSQCPSLAGHLEPFAKKAAKRQDKGEYWWELRACEYYDEFEKSKIVYPEMAKESRFVFDKKGFYTNNKAFIIPADDLFLFAVLNSQIAWNYLKRSCSVIGDADKGGRLELRDSYMRQFPVPRLDLSRKDDANVKLEIESSVRQILTLNEKLAEAKTAQQEELLKRQISAVDDNIDKLVRRIYDVS